MIYLELVWILSVNHSKNSTDILLIMLEIRKQMLMIMLEY